MNITSKDEYVWGFKFRPTEMNEMILPNNLMVKFNSIITKNNITNLLLHGEPGLGKTTVAFIIANKLDRETMYINCSLETGIDLIRDKLDKYCSSSSWTPGVKKLIILDEFDGLSSKAEKALKVFIETFGKYCDFIFITNHVMEISSKLKSRLQNICFDIPKLDQLPLKQKLAKRLTEICDSENVEWDKAGITTVINEYFPDIRKILNESQNLSDYDGIKGESVKKFHSIEINEYLDAVKSKNYQKLQNIVINLTVSPSNFFDKLFKEGIKRIKSECRGEFILQISDYLSKSEKSSQPHIHLCAFSIIMLNNITIL